LEDEQVVGMAAAVTKLYVLAVLYDAEEKIHGHIRQVFADVRRTYVNDLSGPTPYQLLIKMEQAFQKERQN